MERTTEARQEKLQEVAQETRDLYGSIELAKHIKTVREKYAIQKGPEFVDIIGDTLLGFYTITALPDVLERELGIDSTQAKQITSEFIEILSLGTDGGNNTAPKPTEVQVPTPNYVAQNISVPETTVLTAENPIVQPLQTMDRSLNNRNGYGASENANVNNEMPSETADVAPSSALTQQTPISDGEEIVHATSQYETFEKHEPPSNLPTDTGPEKDGLK